MKDERGDNEAGVYGSITPNVCWRGATESAIAGEAASRFVTAQWVARAIRAARVLRMRCDNIAQRFQC